jgi:ABC-type multidrug transport system ATPase subunit
MGVGIRTEALRKVFTSAPPIGGMSRPAGRRVRGQAKPPIEIVALKDLSLEVRPGEIFGLLGPMAPASRRRSAF